jgi:hypothetical protein
MGEVRFESKIPVFEQAKTFHALDFIQLYMQEFWFYILLQDTVSLGSNIEFNNSVR